MNENYSVEQFENFVDECLDCSDFYWLSAYIIDNIELLPDSIKENVLKQLELLKEYHSLNGFSDDKLSDKDVYRWDYLKNNIDYSLLFNAENIIAAQSPDWPDDCDDYCEDYNDFESDFFFDEKYDINYSLIPDDREFFDNQEAAAMKLCYDVCKDKTDDHGVPLLFYAYNPVQEAYYANYLIKPLYYVLKYSSYTATELVKMGFYSFDVEQAAELFERVYDDHLDYLDRISNDYLLRQFYLSDYKLKNNFYPMIDPDINYVERFLMYMHVDVIIPVKEGYNECRLRLLIYNHEQYNIEFYYTMYEKDFKLVYTADYSVIESIKALIDNNEAIETPYKPEDDDDYLSQKMHISYCKYDDDYNGKTYGVESKLISIIRGQITETEINFLELKDKILSVLMHTCPDLNAKVASNIDVFDILELNDKIKNQTIIQDGNEFEYY